MSNGKFSDK